MQLHIPSLDQNTHRLEGAETNPVLVPRPNPNEHEYIQIQPCMTWSNTTAVIQLNQIYYMNLELLPLPEAQGSMSIEETKVSEEDKQDNEIIEKMLADETDETKKRALKDLLAKKKSMHEGKMLNVYPSLESFLLIGQLSHPIEDITKKEESDHQTI